MQMDYADCKTPGQLIVALLEERGWSQVVLATVMGIDRTLVNKMVHDKRPITAEISIVLGEVFGVPPEEFLGRQKNLELAAARFKARPDPARNTRAHLFAGLPVSEMIERGWLHASGVSDARIESELVRFFNAESLENIEVLPHAAKKTRVNTEATPSQLAWLYRVKQIASEVLVTGRYSEVGIRAGVKKLDALLAAPEEARHVPRILSDCGVRFVIVETLQSAKIDGVCFWLDESSPVVGMTLRHDRMDNFWFVLRHELEHVIRKHGQETVALDAELEGESAGTGSSVPEEERIANAAAASFCVPQDKLQMFIDRKNPLFSDRDVRAFSRMLDIHPGLIVGQIQRRTGRYNLLRKHLAKIRTYVTPGSFIDGWGDVFPIES